MARRTLKQRVRAGEMVGGAMVIEFFSPGMAKIAVEAGCEFLIYDMEHSGLSIETLKMLYASARGLPIAPIAIQAHDGRKLTWHDLQWLDRTEIGTPGESCD